MLLGWRQAVIRPLILPASRMKGAIEDHTLVAKPTQQRILAFTDAKWSKCAFRLVEIYFRQTRAAN